LCIEDKQQEETRNPGPQALQKQKAAADQLLARRELERHRFKPHLFVTNGEQTKSSGQALKKKREKKGPQNRL